MWKIIMLSAGLLYSVGLSGQLRLALDPASVYWGQSASLPERVSVLDPGAEAWMTVEGLLGRVGLEPNFDLLSGNVPGVVALRGEEGERLLLYHHAFLGEVRRGDWAATGLLLQAMAHHLSYHSFSVSDSKRAAILEADRLAGSWLARLGANRAEAPAYLLRYAPEMGGPDCPPRVERLLALWAGFDQASVVELPKSGLINRALPGETRTSRSLSIPSFPFPPPKASASHNLPRRLLGNVRTLADVDEKLSDAVIACDYIGKSYYSVPGGFVLVTRIEQIDPGDASSLKPPARWSAEVNRLEAFSIKEYLRALFFGQTGSFRVFAFIVTSYPFYQSRKTVSREEAEKWLTAGLNRLPPELGRKPFTEDHSCTVLVYEFEVNEAGNARLLEPSPFSSMIHLERAGILANLHRP